MAKAPTGRAVAAQAKGSTALSTEMANTLLQHRGAGTERVGLQDMLLPRLKILQALSPEVNRRNPAYIQGAEPGLIVNVATRQLFASIRVVPAFYLRHHIEWMPNRGGFVADHGDNEGIMSKVVKRDEKKFDILANGNMIVPTPTWYVVLIDGVTPDGEVIDLGLDPGIISMPRTQSKPSRQWMSQATSEKITHPTEGQFQAPLFYRSWTLTTVETNNDQGDWAIWSASPSDSLLDEGKLPAGTMERALFFREQVSTGAIRASAEHFADDDSSSNRSREDEHAPM